MDSKFLSLDDDDDEKIKPIPMHNKISTTSIPFEVLKERYGSVFRFVPEDIASEIDWVYAFPSRIGSIFSTRRGYLYSVGKNSSGQLGFETATPLITPKRLPIIQQIKQVVYASGGSTFLLTKTGKIFSCGQNSSGTLGQGHTTAQYNFQLISAPVFRNVVVDTISCGSSFVMALSDEGKLYGWGVNSNSELGLGNTNTETTPVLVARTVTSRIVSVACGNNHTFILCEPKTGDNYSVVCWGYNGYGQLGLGDTNNRNVPTVLPLDPIINPAAASATANPNATTLQTALPTTLPLTVHERKEKKEKEEKDIRTRFEGPDAVIQIASTSSAVFLLTKKGMVYSCGSNGSGELGHGDSSNRNRFALISFFENRELFVHELTASSLSSLIVARVSSPSSSSSSLYAWGSLTNLSSRVPLPFHLANIKSLDDVFMLTTESGFTFRPISIRQNIWKSSSLGPDLLTSVYHAFDSADMSDIIFVVENKSIYVHSFVISQQCEHFKTMLANQWSGVNERKIVIKEYSYAAYYTFLKFLYTGELKNIDAVLAVQVMDISVSYNHKDLQIVCENVIKHTISIHNVADLAALSMKYDAQRLRQQCVSFAANNLPAILAMPNFKTAFPDSMVKDIIILAHSMGKLLPF